MLLLLRCCVLRYASAAAVAVYVAVAAAGGVGSGASVRTLRQLAPASFGGVLLLPEGRMVVRIGPTHRPPVGSRAAPAAAAMAPAYALLRVALAGAPCVLGRVGGLIARAQAPTHRPHAFEAALAYPPWRWLTLPISGHLPSRR